MEGIFTDMDLQVGGRKKTAASPPNTLFNSSRVTVELSSSLGSSIDDGVLENRFVSNVEWAIEIGLAQTHHHSTARVRSLRIKNLLKRNEAMCVRGIIND